MENNLVLQKGKFLFSFQLLICVFDSQIKSVEPLSQASLEKQAGLFVFVFAGVVAICCCYLLLLFA